MKKNKFLGSVESAVLDFRHLFTEYGYRPFKMSKFEEPDAEQSGIPPNYPTLPDNK